MAISQINGEREMLIKVSAGDEIAFCVIFDHYKKYVFSFGRKLTHSEEMAEEIVQDIFLKIWLDREKLKHIDNFGAYLSTLVRNHSFNLLRSITHKQRADKAIQMSLLDHDNGTQNMLDYRGTVEILNEAIELLPDQQKLVYLLCHRDGLKYTEAAMQMNISSTTVHYHMKLALSSIRIHFSKYHISCIILLLLFLLK